MRSSSSIAVVSANRSRSKSRSVTDTVESTFVASSPSRETRVPMTARTLGGAAPGGTVGLCRRPTPRRRVLVDRAADSERLRNTSATKRSSAVGLPVEIVCKVHTGIVEDVPGSRLP